MNQYERETWDVLIAAGEDPRHEHHHHPHDDGAALVHAHDPEHGDLDEFGSLPTHSHGGHYGACYARQCPDNNTDLAGFGDVFEAPEHAENTDTDLAGNIAGFVIAAAHDDLDNWGMDGFGRSDEIVDGVRRILAGDDPGAVLEHKRLRDRYDLLEQIYVSKYQSLTHTGIVANGKPWPECSTWRPLTDEGQRELDEIGQELDDLELSIRGYAARPSEQ
jgi:hypothetical protein